MNKKEEIEILLSMRNGFVNMNIDSISLGILDHVKLNRSIINHIDKKLIELGYYNETLSNM